MFTHANYSGPRYFAGLSSVVMLLFVTAQCSENCEANKESLGTITAVQVCPKCNGNGYVFKYFKSILPFPRNEVCTLCNRMKTYRYTKDDGVVEYINLNEKKGLHFNKGPKEVEISVVRNKDESVKYFVWKRKIKNETKTQTDKFNVSQVIKEKRIQYDEQLEGKWMLLRLSGYGLFSRMTDRWIKEDDKSQKFLEFIRTSVEAGRMTLKGPDGNLLTEPVFDDKARGDKYPNYSKDEQLDHDRSLSQGRGGDFSCRTCGGPVPWSELSRMQKHHFLRKGPKTVTCSRCRHSMKRRKRRRLRKNKTDVDVTDLEGVISSITQAAGRFKNKVCGMLHPPQGVCNNADLAGCEPNYSRSLRRRLPPKSIGDRITKLQTKHSGSFQTRKQIKREVVKDKLLENSDKYRPNETTSGGLIAKIFSFFKGGNKIA